MSQSSDDKIEFVSVAKAAKMLGVTTKTLRNWDELGRIKTIRTIGNHRRVPYSEIERLKTYKENIFDTQ